MAKVLLLHTMLQLTMSLCGGTSKSLSLQCHVVRAFQAGEQNLGKVTIENIGSYQLMKKRVGKYPGSLSAGSILGCSTVLKARVSDMLIFATEI